MTTAAVSPAPSLRRQRLLVFLVPLLLALPFIGRAYFVDDHYFVEIARWLSVHPGRPYDFRTDDAGLQNPGWEKNGFVRMVNPLGHQYLLAAVIRLFGEHVPLLRFACALLSAFSAVIVFEFARRWTSHATLAALLAATTPAAWLTSYSLLIDGTMAFFAFAGFYAFIRFFETDRTGLAVASGFLMGLSILSKYTGLFVLPLSATWLVLRWPNLRGRGRALIAWGVALACLAAYSAYTNALYGAPHIVAASRRMLGGAGWAKGVSLLVFFSGSTLLTLLAWLVARPAARVGALILFVLMGALFASGAGGFTAGQAFLLSLWFTTTLLFLWPLASLLRSPLGRRDAILVLWIAGFFGMMVLVMDWVAVRYYCLVVPAVAMAVVRMVEEARPAGARRLLSAVLAAQIGFTALLAVADWKQAEPARNVVTRLKTAGLAGGARHFYLGDTFTMSYLKEEGWTPAFPDTRFQVGDVILAKEVTMPLIWFHDKPIVVEQVAEFDYPSRLPIKVMDYRGSAGFYASVWGALPFTFSRGPWERFRVLRVVAVKPQ